MRIHVHDGLLIMKRGTARACILFFGLLLFVTVSAARQLDMRLWYNQPAENRSDSLALGNGRMGAVLHHGVEEELIQFSEETLWANRHVGVEEGCRLRDKIPALWKLLDERKFEEANAIVEDYAFDDRPLLRHELMAHILLKFPQHGEHSDYRRELDMRMGVARLTYTIDGAHYTRESMISAVDDVMVIRVSCDQPGKISFDLMLEREGAASIAEIVSSGDQLRMHGPGGSPGSGLMFDLQVKAVAQGGEIRSGEKVLQVRNADSVLLFINAETNFEWGKLLDINLEQACREKIDVATTRNFQEIRADHVADHSGYFNRCELHLGDSTPEQRRLPTNERLDRMRGGSRVERPSRREPYKPITRTTITPDPELEAQIFQFARYLLISSSRPGTQPATLHGIWPNEIGVEGHNMAYHLNINIAENYWPAEVTGLPEMHLPLIDLLENYIPNARIYAREGYGCGGIVCGHNIDPWFSASRRGQTQAAAQWVGGFGWKAQHVWWHYVYSGDKQFLRERGLPIMLEAAEFLLDYSRPDPVTGEIYIGPSGSPENSFLIEGAENKRLTVDYGISIDQEIAHEVFRHCIEGADTLGIQNHPLIERLKLALPNLALPRIGNDGRLLEWRDERVEEDPRHRHVSHMYGFHPGNRITVDQNPDLVEALKKTLRYRFGGGVEADYAPGRLDWQQSWYLNIYARMRDRDMFERVYWDFHRMFMEPNLNSWWATRPYVMDASGAITAGMAEALMQSHTGTIHLLPCLPKTWKTGSFKGFRARGGVTVNANWDANSLSATLIANQDGIFKVRYGDQIREIRLKQLEPVNVVFEL